MNPEFDEDFEVQTMAEIMPRWIESKLALPLTDEARAGWIKLKEDLFGEDRA